MKSMLYEASSVMKAIEKAWAESGNPSDFTVKVLEREEKNFFGFTKKPAVVSIAYDPRRQQHEKSSDRNRDKKNSSRNDARAEKSVRQNSFDKDASAQRKDGFGKDSGQSNKQTTQTQNQRHKFVEKEPAKLSEKPQAEVIDGWTPEFVDQVVVWMKEMLAVMGIQSNATTKIDRKALMVNFDNVLLDSPEDERLLFINMSFVLIQFLKKKHKKKFRGFHIIIQSKAS